MEDFKCEIRKAKEEDCESLMKLLRELAISNKNEYRFFLDINSLRTNGFGDVPLFKCLVAEYEEELIGFVLYNFMYSSLYGKVAFLEAYFVKEAFRKRGIGRRLLKSAIQDSLTSDCRMMQWMVSKGNTEIVDYYKRLGAIDLTEQKNVNIMRFLKDEMIKLIE